MKRGLYQPLDVTGKDVIGGGKRARDGVREVGAELKGTV